MVLARETTLQERATTSASNAHRVSRSYGEVVFVATQVAGLSERYPL